MSLILDKNKSILILILISIIGFDLSDLLGFIYSSQIMISLKFIFVALYLILLFKKSSVNQEEILKNKLFLFLLIWTIVAYLIAFKLNYNYFRIQLMAPYLILPFTFPFLSKKLRLLKFSTILSIIHYCNLIYIVLLMVFSFNNIIEIVGFIEVSGKYFVYSNIFMLFFWLRLTVKQKFLSFLAVSLGLGLSLFFARRAMSFVLISSVLIAIIMINFQRKGVFRRFYLLLLLFVIVVLSISVYQKYENSFFLSINERLFANTRESVSYDFLKDMSSLDLIIGRGIGGTFYAYTSGLGSGQDMQRNGIETGFLDYILKGGIIYIVLLLLLFLKAIYNAVFKSKNVYSKCLAAYIFIYIIELYPSGTVLFSLRFLLIWYSVILLYNNKFLGASNKDVIKYYY